MLLVFIVMAIGLLRMARDLNLYFIMQLIMIWTVWVLLIEMIVL